MASPSKPFIDLSGYAVDAREGYPEMGKRISSMFYGHHFQESKVGGEHVLVHSCRADDLARLYAELVRKPESIKQYAEMPGMNDPHERSEFMNKEFSGMPKAQYVDEIMGKSHRLMDRLNKARGELEKSSVKEALESHASSIKRRRKRSLSEHDGDFDLDRRFDTHPFLTTLHAPKAFPYIELVYPIAFNAGTSAEAIAEFAARSLALAEVLESAGYRVAITAEAWIADLLQPNIDQSAEFIHMGAKGLNRLEQVTRFVVRGPDEYGSVGNFSMYAGSEFFRRICFALSFAAGHYAAGFKHISNCVDYGYGQSLSERPIASNPGQVILDMKTAKKIFTLGGMEAEELFKEHILNTIAPKEAVA